MDSDNGQWTRLISFSLWTNGQWKGEERKGKGDGGYRLVVLVSNGGERCIGMRKFRAFVLVWCLVVCFFVLPGCHDEGSLGETGTPLEPDAAAASYHKISAQRAKEVMDSGEAYVLLDVRTEGEFTDKRIDGAVLIPDFEIAERALTELPDKAKLILVYCRSGGRSAGAAKVLVKMGYTNVYDFGGINDWPYDTVSGRLPAP